VLSVSILGPVRELFTLERFAQTPPQLRRLNDIAFSGDGEPTTCPEFPQLLDAVADMKRSAASTT